MHVAFRGPRPDRSPGHGVGDVLRRGRVQPLAADRHPEAEYVHQQPPGGAQASVDVVAAVHARVVDQALPAGHRVCLLKVRAHHDQQVVGELVSQRAEAARIVKRCHRVMDGARPGDHE